MTSQPATAMTRQLTADMNRPRGTQIFGFSVLDFQSHRASHGCRRYRTWASGLLAAMTCVLVAHGADAPDATARWLTVPVAEVRDAAERGDAGAQYGFGERLLRGNDGRADLLAAYDWFARAGSNGVVEAQLRMGMKHERAVAGPRDLAEASRWYQLAAEKGSDAARFRLACVNSMNRHAGKLDAPETLRWSQSLAERGHRASVQLRAAMVLPAQAVPFLRESAQLGDMASARRLSNQLAGSDPKEATYWDAVARAAGDTNISFSLARAQGKMTQSEISAEKERAKTFQPKRAGFVLLGELSPLHHIEVELQSTAAARTALARIEAAAQRGEAEAQFQLALAHQLAPAFTNHMAALDGSRRVGNGIVLNNDRVPQPHMEAALRWHTAAAKQGHRDAGLCIAWLYRSGALDSPREADALPWLKVAADAGHAESAYQIYQLRLGGHGMEKTNDPEAKNRRYAETLGWLKRAAELNHLAAMTNYATRLYQSSDQTQALRILRAAADRGDAGSAARLKEWFGLTHSAAAVPAAPVVSAAAVVTPTAGAPRLAVVPLAESLRPLADLLTAELSAKPGVTLVERAELDRVFREQNLNAANTSALKLGELLNAQGILLLETNSMANARLVAVAPGVLLAGASVSLPLTNAPEWSRQLTAQFAPWLGKLAVARGAAVPVSLLGLRMATAAVDGPEIEQGLSLLFLHRLTREREVFALERRRLEQLAAEQEIVDGTNSFWSGGALVDGAIERDLSDRKRITVRMQVTPAGAARVSFDATGSTTNLAALADALAVKLLGALQRTPKSTWDPAEEAITFYQEAGWLARWGQWEPALAAMESAWALGLRGASHSVLRQQLLVRNFRFVKLRWPAEDGFPELLRQPPSSANLELAARAMAAYAGHSRELPTAALTNNPPWLPMGALTLEYAGRVLEEFHRAPEHSAERREQLGQLRADTRTFLADLRALHTRAGTTGNWGHLDYLFRLTVLNQRDGEVQLPFIEGSFGAFWAEDPKAEVAARRAAQAKVPFTLPPGVHIPGLTPSSVPVTTTESKVASVPPTTPAAPTPITPGPDALRVTRFWSGPELRRPVQSFFSVPLNPDQPVYQRKLVVQDWSWSEGRLWVAWRHDLTARAPGGFAPQSCSHITSYSLPDFAGDADPDELPEPVQLPALFQPPQQQRAGRFAVAGGQLFVAGSNTVWRVAKGASAPLKLELVGEPVLAAAHGRLLISAPDELYLHDVSTGATELLTSARRKPSLNAADAHAQGHAQVAELPGGRMRVFFRSSAALDYDFGAKSWTGAPGMQGTVHRIHADSLEALSSRGNGVFASQLLPHSGTNWQLAALRLPPSPRDVQALSTGIQLPGVPRWYPADPELSPAWLGTTSLSNRFWSVTSLDIQRGSDGPALRASTNGYHVRLAAWRNDLPQPAVIPLWLEVPAGTLLTGPEGRFNQMGLPAGVPGTLLATPPGLVYRVGPASGFWFIPWSDVLPRVEAQFSKLAAARLARPSPGNHRGRQLLHTYDLDDNGKVDGGEFGALFSGEKLDAGANASRNLSTHFNSADRNRDNGLDGDELSTVGDLIRARSVPSSVQLPPQMGFGGPQFGPRPPGVPGQPFRPGPPFTQQPDLKQFDKNQDGRIDEEEGKALQQHLQQQQADRMRPQQLPAGPPPPEILERYDKNKNGKMDPDEMQEFLREMMSGKSPRPRGTNVPPAPPVPAPKAPPTQP